MKKLFFVLLISLMPLYGGMREMAFSELQNTATYIKSVAPRIRESGSQKAMKILQKAIEGVKKAKWLFNHGNYQLSMLYAREAKELASFAVKIAIGRIKSRRGILLCRNGLEYINTLDNIKEHQKAELQRAITSLKNAEMYFQKEQYKASLIESRSCLTILKSAIGRSKMLSNISPEIIKSELRSLKKSVESTNDSEIKAMYNRAIAEYQRGNYGISLLLLKSIRKRILDKKNILNLKIKTIEARIKSAHLSPELKEKVYKLFNLYVDAISKGNRKTADKYYKEIQRILSESK